nr:MAG TPA: hypothetical protein [Caudoviricetes sp.]
MPIRHALDIERPEKPLYALPCGMVTALLILLMKTLPTRLEISSY